MALFADSANGICASFSDLADYASSLKVSVKYPAEPHSYYYSDTGYLCLVSDSVKCIASLGGPAPDYQPGHTHCDMFSFELSWEGHPFIVDTGVYEYAEGKERYYSRSTQAHNCVQYGHNQQHEIWGAFRLAHRAKSEVLNVETTEQGGSFLAQHDGFSRVKKELVHKRLFRLENKRLIIEDELGIAGRQEKQSVPRVRDYLKARPLVSRLHFHPDVQVGVFNEASGTILLSIKNESVAYLALRNPGQGDIQVDIQHCDYFPEFGQKRSGTCLEIVRFGTLPNQLSLSIEFK